VYIKNNLFKCVPAISVARMNAAIRKLKTERMIAKSIFYKTVEIVKD
jgi:hypothetical protein